MLGKNSKENAKDIESSTRTAARNRIIALNLNDKDLKLKYATIKSALEAAITIKNTYGTSLEDDLYIQLLEDEQDEVKVNIMAAQADAKRRFDVLQLDKIQNLNDKHTHIIYLLQHAVSISNSIEREHYIKLLKEKLDENETEKDIIRTQGKANDPREDVVATTPMWVDNGGRIAQVAGVCAANPAANIDSFVVAPTAGLEDLELTDGRQGMGEGFPPNKEVLMRLAVSPPMSLEVWTGKQACFVPLSCRTTTTVTQGPTGISSECTIVRQGAFYPGNNMDLEVSSPKPMVTTSQQQATTSPYNANNSRVALNKDFIELQGVQKEAVKTQELPGIRVPYYGQERLAKIPGPKRRNSYS